MQIFLSCLGELVEFRDAFGGSLPAFEAGVGRLNFLKAAHVRGDLVAHLAVNAIAGADWDLSETVENIHLGYHQPFGPVDLVGVAQEWQIEPSAAAGPSGHCSILLAAGAQQIAAFAPDLGGERSLAYAGHIGLGHTDHGPDRGRSHPGADNGATGGCRGGGYEGI